MRDANLLTTTVGNTSGNGRIFTTAVRCLLRVQLVAGSSAVEHLLNLHIHTIPAGGIFRLPREDCKHATSFVQECTRFPGT